ncbi:HAD family hydrolase [Paenibacillus thalictri]|uniref:HAD family hydrolase n=1 Tax=Paenibacillus thalictri TaxID=2527873 RepID=A0A4Q9DWM2_9BACL|nr:HAD family hydrolase [Paenibacillus thalictri]TBL80147.1 HAD family hydrolase [Paenibacillus thalictri]
MSKIRLVVSDLDGTLLTEDSKLTGEVIAAVERFRSSGGLFTIATGRYLGNAIRFADELDIDLPLILCNGSVMAKRDRIVEAALLPIGPFAALLKDADAAGLTVLMYPESGGIRALSRTLEVEEFEACENHPCLPPDDEWERQRVQKLLLIGDMRQLMGIWNGYRPQLQDQCSIVQSGDHSLEMIPIGQNKGNALQRLMAQLNVHPDEVMAIGNHLNDVEMIETAGIGVAVANSHPGLIAKASYVCRQSYGEGVVEAMGLFCNNT